jgi:hypothetical protein
VTSIARALRILEKYSLPPRKDDRLFDRVFNAAEDAPLMLRVGDKLLGQ